MVPIESRDPPFWKASLSKTMASPSKKPRQEADLVSKVGYLHNVTSIKSNTNGSVNYFTGQIQYDRENFQRFVSFNTRHHQAFVDAEKKKNPVKLASCLLTRSLEREASNDLKYVSSSTISFAEQLDFQFRQPISINQQTQSKTVSIQQFLTLGSMQKGNLTAKVVSTFPEEQVQTKYGQRTLKKAVLGDETGAITCCLWEEMRNLVKENTCYTFSNLSLNYYQGSQYASATKASKIEEEPLLDIAVKSTTSEAITQVEAVEVSRKTKCPSCKVPLTASNSQKTVKCTSCNKRCLTSALYIDIKCQIKIIVDKCTKELSLPITMMNGLLSDLQCITDNPDTMEEEILIGGPYKFTFHGADLLKMELKQDDIEK